MIGTVVLSVLGVLGGLVLAVIPNLIATDIMERMPGWTKKVLTRAARLAAESDEEIELHSAEWKWQVERSPTSLGRFCRACCYLVVAVDARRLRVWARWKRAPLIALASFLGLTVVVMIELGIQLSRVPRDNDPTNTSSSAYWVSRIG